jgi:hypothetical protein
MKFEDREGSTLLFSINGLIIELDGGQPNAAAQRQDDSVRDQRLRSQGFRILRSGNNVFDEWAATAEAVWKAVQDGPPPHRQPLSRKGRKNTDLRPRAEKGLGRLGRTRTSKA